jgi:hypothetical protein
VVTRAVTGAIAGAVGALVTVIVGFAGFMSFCGVPSATRLCTEVGSWLLPVVLGGGLIGTALLHVWLLKLRGQPRPWSVAAPGAALVVVLVMSGWGIGLVQVVAVPATAFAVAGVITGFGSWREIMGKVSR